MATTRRRRYDSPPHLPPRAAAPIVEYYDLETKRIDRAHQYEAPVDDRGVVDVFKTVELALSLVDDEYIWPRTPKPDIHHFVWPRDHYHPRHFNGSTIPRDYRDKIAFQKGYISRSVHDWLHAVIAPPEVPDFSVMEARLSAYDSVKLLFESAKGAVTALHRPSRISGIPHSSETGELMIDEEILLQVMIAFESRFESTRALVLPDNEFIDDFTIIQQLPEVVARHLGRVAGHNAINFMPIVYGNRRAA